MPTPPRLSGLAGPLFGRRARLRWVHLILGAALLMPFSLLTLVIAEIITRSSTPSNPLPTELVAYATALPLAAAVGLLPPVRTLESSAARVLLGEPASSGDPHAPGARPRTALWFVLHLGIGAPVAGFILAIPPLAAVMLASPLLARHTRASVPYVRDVPPWSGPLIALGLLAALLVVVTGAGVLLARCAPALLGPSAAERIAAAEQRATRLAERNRLARELHDSVGHALSIVTVQAGAATRVMESDPEFVRRALAAIEGSARDALTELDHVLGLLREGAADDGPQPDLTDLPRLVEATTATGTDVRATVAGDLSGLPGTVSREAYRIVQEGFTNALRHAGPGPVDLSITAGADHLEVRMSNPIPAGQARGSGGGRGLAGISERAAALGGTCTAGKEGDRWRLSVQLPLGGGR